METWPDYLVPELVPEPNWNIETFWGMRATQRPTMVGLAACLAGWLGWLLRAPGKLFCPGLPGWLGWLVG